MVIAHFQVAQNDLKVEVVKVDVIKVDLLVEVLILVLAKRVSNEI